MAEEWITFDIDFVDEGELSLNCLCAVTTKYDYPDRSVGVMGGYTVSVEIIRTTIGNLTVTRDMLVQMRGEDGIAGFEAGVAETMTEDANDSWAGAAE